LDLLNLIWRDLHNARIWKDAPVLARDIYKDHYANYRRIFHRARPFNLDSKALRVAIELSMEGPEKMADRLLLARLPFPEMWIEFDLHDKLFIGNELGISPGPAEDTPSRIGYLLQEDPGDHLRWTATTWVSVDSIRQPVHKAHRDEMLTSVAMNAWMIDTEKRAIPERIGAINGVTRQEIESAISLNIKNGDYTKDDAWRAFAHLGWGYGSTMDDVKEAYDGIDPMRVLGQVPLLQNSINVGWEPLSYQIRPISTGRINEQFANSCVESRGDMRTLVSILALINEVPIIETPVERKGSFIGAGGVIKKYLTNKTVTINIPSRKPLKQIQRLLAKKVKSHKARHEVRGHWRTIIHKNDHWRKDNMPDGTIVRTFIAAGQLERVWVESHERGDASYGYVKHDYKIEKRK
jgi:hypothetical protein